MSTAGFPELKIDPSDVFGSWDRFIRQFEVDARLREKACGTRRVGDQDRPVFDDELKCLALIKAVGDEGQRVIESKGHDVRVDELTYKEVSDILKAHYGREESVNVKTRNFVTARQLSGEDNRDYLRRVEQLSRNLRFFKSENAAASAALQEARQSLAVVIAVNGLRDLAIRRELLAQPELSWERLCEVLMSRCTAEETEAKLEVKLGPAVPVRTAQSVSEVRFDDTRNRRYDRDSRPRHDSGGRRDSYTGAGGYQSSRYTDRGYERPGRNSDTGTDRRSYRREESREKRSGYREGKDKQPSSSDRFGRRCYGCDQRGHIVQECPRVKCHECGNRGHIMRTCPYIKCYECGARGHMSKACPTIRRSQLSSPARYERSDRSPYRSRSRSPHFSRQRNPGPAYHRRSPSPRQDRNYSPDNNRSSRRSPSPYPHRGRESYPDHYMRRVKESEPLFDKS